MVETKRLELVAGECGHSYYKILNQRKFSEIRKTGTHSLLELNGKFMLFIRKEIKDCPKCSGLIAEDFEIYLKSCANCKLDLLVSLFTKDESRYSGLSKYCKSCIFEKTNLPALKKRTSEYNKIRHANNKMQMILEYGGECQCCGEKEMAFLTIDHINNDGAKERAKLVNDRKKTDKKFKKFKFSGTRLFSHLKKLGFPKDRYQLLCFNCNAGRYINGGICPHKGKT